MNAPPLSPQDARLRDELHQQKVQLDQEKWVRLGATMLAFAMGLVYLPPWIVLPLAATNLFADIVGARLFNDPDRMAVSPRLRALAIVSVFVIETTFVLPAGIMWHFDDPFAKSLAIGLAASAMMHLSTVRAIHLPQGLWGAGALALVVLVSNTAYWVPRGQWAALGLTTVSALTALGYFVMAMITNHQVHRQAAADHRAAREAGAAKDRLLATISHELRTPLNGILGMGHAELAQAATPEARERLSVLVASAEGLGVILDDILDLSAAQDGRLAIRPGAAIPADEIAATVTLFRHGNSDGDGLVLDLSPDLSQPAWFDRQRLRQCLSNLLSNALRHGQGAAVRVAGRRATGPDGRTILDLTVADDGPGVPEAFRHILFEPFARLPGPTPQGARQGQGLGLTIARSLARLMGGDIVLLPAGSGGRGATFRLTMVLAPVPAGHKPPVRTTFALEGTPRVLVVDDIATNRIVAAYCLRLAGAEATEAESGRAALARLGADRFDAVCLDMNMPDMDGLTMLAAIRALDGPAAQVAVIAMTADAGEARRAKYLAAGCDGYLAKPVTPDSVADVLARTLANRRDRRATLTETDIMPG